MRPKYATTLIKTGLDKELRGTKGMMMIIMKLNGWTRNFYHSCLLHLRQESTILQRLQGRSKVSVAPAWPSDCADVSITSY